MNFFRFFSRLPELLYTPIELLSFQELLFFIIFHQDYESKKNVKANLRVKKSPLFEKYTFFTIAMQKSTQDRQLIFSNLIDF